MVRSISHRRQIGGFIIAFGIVAGLSLLHWATTPAATVVSNPTAGHASWTTVEPTVNWLTAGPVLMVLFAIGFFIRIQAFRAARTNDGAATVPIAGNSK